MICEIFVHFQAPVWWFHPCHRSKRMIKDNAGYKISKQGWRGSQRGGGGEESSLFVLGYHLLPLFICCAAAEAGEMRESGRKRRSRRAGLHVFLLGSATLSPGRWARKGRREARQTEVHWRCETWAPSLPLPSVPPPPPLLPPRQRLPEKSDPQSPGWKLWPKEKKTEPRMSRDPRVQSLRSETLPETENWNEADQVEQRGGEMNWRSSERPEYKLYLKKTEQNFFYFSK